MIIEVSREFGQFTWTVRPLADDGTPLVRNGREVTPTDSTWPWATVGRMISAQGSDHEVTVRYRDDNNMRARRAAMAQAIRHAGEQLRQATADLLSPPDRSS